MTIVGFHVSAPISSIHILITHMLFHVLVQIFVISCTLQDVVDVCIVCKEVEAVP